MVKYESQRRAVREYQKRNPQQTTYNKNLSIAKTFIKPNPNTKNAEAIEWAKANGRYFDDLRALRDMLNNMDL